LTAAARQRLVYVMASSHSGSTLLALLLASHPEVTTVGELNASAIDDPDRYRCSCGTLIRECEFWRRMAERMAGHGFQFDVTQAATDYRAGAGPLTRRLLAPLHRGPLLEWCRDTVLKMSPEWRRRLPALQARNAALAACVAAESNARVVVDSSKVGLRLKFLLRNRRLDVLVLRLVRDGRAVALTYMDPARYADAADPAMRGGGFGGTRERERIDMTAAARQWRRGQEEAEAIRRTVPRDRWMDVRYETLCREPEETLSRLFRFVGVDAGRPRMPFRRAGRHVVGNGMRLDSTDGVRLDDRWATELGVSERKMFDAVAGAWNRRLGYQS